MRRVLSVTIAAIALAAPAMLAQRGSVTPPTPPTVTPPVATPVGQARGVGPRPIGSPAPPEALIVGQVVDQAGKGVPRAAVRLIGDSVIETVLTDERGRFFFRRLAPGETIVTAQKTGYFDGAFGQRRANGMPLPFTIGFGQPIVDMRIELYRGAVITGSVVDEAGEPIAGVTVEARRRHFADGAWEHSAAGTDVTDDLGQYRIYGLRPGEYIVSTAQTMYSVPMAELEAIGTTGSAGGMIGGVMMHMPGDSGLEKAQRAETHARVTGDGAHLVWSASMGLPDRTDEAGMYAPQYYPATDRRPLALPVRVAAGDVRHAVNFQLAWVPAFAVRGRLVGEAGTAGHQLVRLLPISDDGEGADDAAMTTSARDGTFTFPRVPPGRYRVVVEANPETAFARVAPKPPPGEEPPPDVTSPPRLWARTDVAVSDEDVDVPELWLRPAVHVTGVLVMEADPALRGAASALPRLPITVAPAGPGLSPSTTASFDRRPLLRLLNRIPGEYYVRVGAPPPGWFLKSVTVDGQDALDEPVDIGGDGASLRVTLTTRATQLIGTVRDARMLAASGATVIIMPAASRRDAGWTPNRTRETRASTNGVFHVTGLPPGDYLVVAIDDAAAEGWQDPAMIARLQKVATRFTLGDAEQKTMQIRISQVPR